MRVAGAFALLLLLAGCGDRSKAVSGTIEVDEAHVGPRAGGRVEKILHWEGDHLHEGQLILQLDASELRARRDLANAQINTALHDADAQQAQLVFLNDEARRQKDLLTRKVVSSSDAERADSSAKTQEKNVAAAQMRVAQARGSGHADINGTSLGARLRSGIVAGFDQTWRAGSGPCRFVSWKRFRWRRGADKSTGRVYPAQRANRRRPDQTGVRGEDSFTQRRRSFARRNGRGCLFSEREINDLNNHEMSTEDTKSKSEEKVAEPMIEVKGLTKRFGTFTAVDHVSFSVGKGSIFGFLGPNGSGKTTVIRMLCGILEPTEGAARIGGHDVVRDIEPIKEMIGYMSQKFSLYDELTVNENLIFAGKLYGLSGHELDQRRDEMIATTHLEPYINRRASNLSGGWRQRLAMACSLMHRPTVLFLDEPTAGIDPVARRELWDLLFEFAGKGMTLFVTTHYMDEAERCDHVGYIYMSKLIVCGEPDDLKKLPDVNPPGTRRLDVTCDHVTTALRAMHEMQGVRSATVFGQSMHLLVDESVKRAQIDEQLRKVGVSHSEIHEMGPSLEDVFVELSAKHAAERQKAA